MTLGSLALLCACNRPGPSESGTGTVTSDTERGASTAAPAGSSALHGHESTTGDPLKPPVAAPADGSQRNVAKPPPFEGTVGIIDVPRELAPATLTEVRSARHDGFDRFVWQFAEQHVPGYHIEYIDKPVRKCGSGDTAQLAGDGWLEIRLYPANAHDEAGNATISQRERQLQLGVARELELTCDFEAVVTWVIGLTSPNHFRVLELTEPPRLVVDIRH